MYRGCREQSFKNPRRADPSPALRSTSSSRSVSNLRHVASQRILDRGATGLKKTSVGETVLSVGECSDAVAFGGADAGQRRAERAATPQQKLSRNVEHPLYIYNPSSDAPTPRPKQLAVKTQLYQQGGVSPYRRRDNCRRLAFETRLWYQASHSMMTFIPTDFSMFVMSCASWDPHDRPFKLRWTLYHISRRLAGSSSPRRQRSYAYMTRRLLRPSKCSGRQHAYPLYRKC